MSQPLVSIILVTYNAAAYIEATMRSCLQQTYRATELLILDNASTDGTAAKIQAIKDPRIKLWQSPENTGPYHGLNTLLKHAKGEYIAIQDHDDLWLPTKLEEQISFLSTHLDFSACGTLTYYFYEDRQVLIIPPNPEVTDFVDHTSLLFRRRDIWYDPARALPDEYFERKTLRQFGPIGCLQTALTIHRIRNDQQNLSTRRTRGNLRGAWEHLQLTGYRDLLGMSLFFFGSFLPAPVRWWLRKNVTLRAATSLSVKEFTKKHQYQLS